MYRCVHARVCGRAYLCVNVCVVCMSVRLCIFGIMHALHQHTFAYAHMCTCTRISAQAHAECAHVHENSLCLCLFVCIGDNDGMEVIQYNKSPLVSSKARVRMETRASPVRENETQIRSPSPAVQSPERTRRFLSFL